MKTRAKESVRICLNQFNSAAIQMDESTMNGVYGPGIKFSGPASKPAEIINDAIFGHELVNYTSVIGKSNGKYNESTGWYDEGSCLYSIQQNETDVSLSFVRLPVKTHGMKHVHPYFRVHTGLLSLYNVTNSVKIPDVLQSFRTAFDGYIWLTLALFALAFIVLVKARINLENKRLKLRKHEHMSQYSKKLRHWASRSAPLNRRLKNNPADGNNFIKQIGRNLSVNRPKLCSRLQSDPRMQLMAPTLKVKEPDVQREPTSLEDNSIWDVLTHLFQVESVDYELAFLRMVLLFITVLSFYIFTYFGSLMSTDMVLAEEPSLIKSYQDLLARGRVQMLFVDFMDDYKEFELAPKGSIKRELWDRSLESVNGRRNELFIKMDSPSDFERSVSSSVMKVINPDQENRVEVVIVFSNWILPVARATICTFKTAIAYRRAKTDPQAAKTFKPVENVYSLVSKDPEEKGTLVSLVLRDGFRSPLAKRITKRGENLLELGTLHYVLEKALANAAVPGFSLESLDEIDEYGKCMSDDFRQNMQKNRVIAIQLVQFELLIYFSFTSLALALVVLLYEIWTKG